MKFDQNSRSYYTGQAKNFAHNTSAGNIDYHRLHYNRYKSIRNRQFMNSFKGEFNNGFRPKYQGSDGHFGIMKQKGANPGMDGPRQMGEGFRNWNNAISNGFRGDLKSRFRRISYNTIQQTYLQDQILREMIKNKEHLNVDNIVAMDIEYGGARTVPRVAIVNFNEVCLYYTDFCMRYEDWVETKITEAAEADQQVDKNENAYIYQNAY